MKKKIFSIIGLFLFISIILSYLNVSNAQISGSHWKRNNTYITPTPTSLEICATGDRCQKFWGTDMDLNGTFTFGGIIGTGGIDLNGEKLTLDADADSYLQSSVDDQWVLNLGATDIINASTTAITTSVPIISADGLNLSYEEKEYTVYESNVNCYIADGLAGFVVTDKLNGANLIDAEAAVATAGTTNTMDFQVRRRRAAVNADMLTTKLTIDSTETRSTTAATPLVVDTSNDDVATGDIIFIDVDACQTTAAQGAFVSLIFQFP